MTSDNLVRTPNASQNAVAQSRLAFIGVANVHLSNGVASAFKVAFFDFLEIACGAEIGCLEPDPPSPKGDPPITGNGVPKAWPHGT
jgi:hypothetical protein